MGSSKKKKEHKKGKEKKDSGSLSSKVETKERKKRKHRSSGAVDEEKQQEETKSQEVVERQTSDDSPPKEKKRKKEERESKSTKSKLPTTQKRDEETGTGENKSSGGSGAELSMSIEETNKVRAQLGLAPLQVDDKPKVKDVQSADGKTTDRVITEDGKEFVHKPAENLSTKKEADSIREKLQALREKRKLDEKFSETKLLGAADEDDSAAAWVSKSKRLEEERRLAELREKMLQEMDEQFGVSETIEKQKKKAVSKKAPDGGSSSYTSKHLAGATVMHSKDALLQSKETYLVLEDKDVLDESEDVLVNPSIKELEQWKKNAELRKKKPGYNPYEQELDEFGMPKRALLGKYDDEIDGEKKDSFKLGAAGDADLSAERERELMLAKLREGAESLQAQPLQLAKEYLTNEEMVKFKKPTKKRVRKVRKRAVGLLKADDLLADAKMADDDFGSRQRGRGRKRADYEDSKELEKARLEKMLEEGEEKDEPMDTSFPVEDDDDLPAGRPNYDEDNDPITLSDDEAEKELQVALARARQLQLAQAQADTKKLGIEKIAELIPKLEEPDEDEQQHQQEDEQKSNNHHGGSTKIVMDSISEYCRGLGDIPTYGMAGNREDGLEKEMFDSDNEDDMEAAGGPSTSKMPADDMDMDEDEQEVEPDRHEEEEEEEQVESRGRWYERDINDLHVDRPPKPSARKRAESDDELSREAILEDEPDMDNMGVAGALKVAMLKGYLKDDKGDRNSGIKLDHLKAQRYTVMDKQFHDIDDKYAKKLERMGGGGGPIVDFREKSDYKPDVKLQYADEKGHLMEEKDAFRYLSWKFHGKAPGKKKVENRSKKLIEKELFNEMSSTDTPLGTLSKQLEKQRQLQLPFIVLSGSGSKDVGTSIRKD